MAENKYRLLKDLPDLESGAIFAPDKNGFYSPTKFPKPCYSYRLDEIVRNTEWFGKINSTSNKCGKVWYFTHGEANKALIEIGANKKKSSKPKSVYFCRECNCYHLTSQTKPDRL